MTAAAEMQVADKLLSIRMTRQQKDLVEERATQEALGASTWAREAVLMLAAGELSLRDIEVAVREAQQRREQKAAAQARTGRPARVVRGAGRQLGRRETLDGRCLHPMHLRDRKPFYDECPCGEIFHR